MTPSPAPTSAPHRLRATLQGLPRDSRDTLFLLAVIAVIVLPLAGHLPLWATLGSLALLGWRATLAYAARALPRRGALWTLLALAVAGTLATHHTLTGRDAGVTLIVLLLALKTLEQHGRRDAMVVFFLGFFTLLCNFFFSQALPVAVAMLVALWGLLAALVNAHMPVGRPPLAQSLRVAARMTVLGAPIMVVLFVFFPRFAPLWGLPTDKLAGKTGLSGQMRVGEIAQLALDDSVAMRVRFLTPEGKPPPQEQLYFRGPVLSEFDGRQWLAYGTAQARWQASTPALLRPQGMPLPYEVTLQAHQQPWLMLLDAAPNAPELPEGYRAFMNAELQWISTRPVTNVLRYRAQSYPQFEHGPSALTPLLRSYTALPAGLNPQTQALAQELLATPAVAAGGTAALVDAALQRLRTGGYTYTLEPGLYGPHTADAFWFEHKEGFCEHIASAFAVLMRSAGVPARIVTGYQGGDMNHIDGYWTVRNSDAHAWTEVWIAPRGWVRVDPTGAVSPARVGQLQRLRAPEGALAGAMQGMISPDMAQRLRAVWEAMNNGWNQWILSYTQGSQLDLLKTLGFSTPDWTDLLRLLALALTLGVLAVSLWLWWERRHVSPWVRLLEQVRMRLQRAGLSIPAHCPPRAIAQQVQAQWGAQGQDVCNWLLRLEYARYAPQDAPVNLSELRRDLRRLHWPAPLATAAASAPVSTPQS